MISGSTRRTVISPLAAIGSARFRRSGPLARAERAGFGLRRLRFAAAVLLLAAVVPVHALTIPFIDAYSETLSAIGVGTGSAGSVVPATGRLFPSALGTLEDIDLQFSGSVNFGILPGLNTVPGAPGVEVPAPYTITPQLSIRINGLTDLYDAEPFVLGTTVVSSGLGAPSSASGSYSFRFSYHELLGQFIGPHDVSASGPIALLPPTALAGQLDDFLSGEALTDGLLLSYTLSFTEFGRVSTAPTVVTAVSSFQVMTTYTYSVVPVPEPVSTYLLVAGIAALAAARLGWARPDPSTPLRVRRRVTRASGTPRAVRTAKTASE